MASKKEGKSGAIKELFKKKEKPSDGSTKEALSKKSQASQESIKKAATGTPKSKKEAKSQDSHDKTATTSKSAASNLPLDEISKNLNYHQWFHGMMPRDEIEDLLKKDGDFLVRKTEVDNKTRYAVSVFYSKRIRHILLNYADGMWSIRKAKKKSIIELIEHLKETKYLVQPEGTILITPIHRPDYYILHEHIEIGKKLGGGAFGDVHLGVWRKGFDSILRIEVAIKKLKGMMHKKERIEFVKEARLMRKFNHPNLVHVLGVAPNEIPMLIVLELCPGGSLHSYLKKNPEVKEDKLTAYTIDACRGMVYLSLRKVIHRDIAARNCLLGKNDECKISDFGLSVANADVLKLDKLKSMPVRWLSPETIKKGEFSTKSDVWSFGIMMWEIFSHCKSDPFPGMSNLEARAKIKSGSDPLEAPEGTPALMKSVMKLCFAQDASSRPDFLTLFKIMAPKETPPAEDEIN